MPETVRGRWTFSLVAVAMLDGRGGGWLAWIVAGVFGGLLALVSATAIRVARRRRTTAGQQQHPPPSTTARTRKTTRLTDSALSPSRLAPGSTVVGYLTVPAGADNGDDGEALAAIEATCERSGWKLLEIVRDRENGRSLERPGLGYALQRIVDGQAKALVISDVERMTRSVVDLGALLAWFRDASATLIALDLDIDTSTPEGRYVASTLIALSAREHDRIAKGTRRGLADGRNGGRVGRPAVRHRPELVERIAAMRAANMTLRAIADQLNAEGVPTLRGGKEWRPSSIQAALGYQRPAPREHLPRPRR